MSDKPKVGVGCGVMILKDNKILLGRRNENPDTADSELRGEGTWTMPGGKLEYQEGFEECACRETLEETGLIVTKVKVICLNNDKNEHAHFVTIGLLVEEFSGEPRVMEPNEITEWRWFDLDNLPSPIFIPSAKVLKNYQV